MKQSTPLKISASAVRAFEECPYRYAKDYVDRLPQAEREPVFHFAFGNAVHRTIANFILNGGWAKVPHLELIQLLHKHWGWEPQGSMERRLSEFQRAKAMIDNFYFKRYPRDVTMELGVERFVSWSEPRNGILATGKLDRVCLVGGYTLEVLDYKTGKPPLENGALANDLQAVFYRTLAADAFREIPAATVKVTFLYLRDGLPLSVEFGREELIERWKRVQRLTDQVRNSRADYEAGRPLREAFPLQRGLQCRTCQMSSHCDGLEAVEPMLRERR